MVLICADEQILKEEGCRDFSQYLAVPGTPEKDLIPDFFLDDVDDPQHNLLDDHLGANFPSRPVAHRDHRAQQTPRRLVRYA